MPLVSHIHIANLWYNMVVCTNPDHMSKRALGFLLCMFLRVKLGVDFSPHHFISQDYRVLASPQLCQCSYTIPTFFSPPYCLPLTPMPILFHRKICSMGENIHTKSSLTELQPTPKDVYNDFKNHISHHYIILASTMLF